MTDQKIVWEDEKQSKNRRILDNFGETQLENTTQNFRWYNMVPFIFPKTQTPHQSTIILALWCCVVWYQGQAWHTRHKNAHEKFTPVGSSTDVRSSTEAIDRPTNYNLRRRMSKRGRHYQIQPSNISRNLVQHGQRSFHLATKRQPLHHRPILRSTSKQWLRYNSGKLRVQRQEKRKVHHRWQSHDWYEYNWYFECCVRASLAGRWHGQLHYFGYW